MMDHVTRNGAPKIVNRCSYPLTGRAVVHRIYTNLAVIRVLPHGLVVDKIAEGLTMAELQTMTDAPLVAGDKLTPLSTQASGA